MTCLAAMCQYGISHFLDKAQEKQDLIIQVVGASTYETPATHVWEEIQHCLPEIQSLAVLFVGPEACSSIKQPCCELPLFSTGCCPECEKLGRTRYYGNYAYTYHEYANKYLEKEKKKHSKHAHATPDLIVAFNSGIHEVDTESWKTTLRYILDMNAPSYFTSYSKEEAIQDWEIISSLDANILHEDECPKLNPFADMQPVIESPPSKAAGIDEFYSCNMYGVLFQGRK